MHYLHESARRGDLKRVKELLRDDPDQVNSKDDAGGTPLHYAAAYGHKAVAELLLANKADVNARDNDGNTPLQRAASEGHKALVKLLRRHAAAVPHQIIQPVPEFMQMPLAVLFIIGVSFLFIIGTGIAFGHSITRKQCFVLVVMAAFYAALIVVILVREKKRNTAVIYFLDRSISPDYIQNARELPEKRIINAILRDKSIPGASESLLVWGSINFVMWFMQHVKIVELLSRFDILSGTSPFLIYGGCMIAVGMLAIGILGKVTKSTLVGYLNGIALVMAGLWNINFDNALTNVVRRFDYELVEKGFNIWVMLGLFQCVWGLLQIYGFWRFGFKPKGITKAVKDDALAKLQGITRSPAKPDAGRFKLTIPSPLLQPLFPRIMHGGTYTVWLLPYKASFLHDKLDDYFEYDRRAVAGLQFKDGVEHLKNGNVKIQIDARLIKFKENSIVLSESALKSFNEWLRIDL